MRIALMVVRLIIFVPYYFGRICFYGITKHYDFEKAFSFIGYTARRACAAGRVRLEVEGLENLPGENGFLLTPNHQGLFDALVFLATCPSPFTVVIKKEASNIILLKQVVKALRAHPIDRDDLRQSLKVIKACANDIKEGRSVLIFPEGTRSKEGNKVGEFKGGSYKIATMMKAPIVPCALVDSFKPFDENSIRPVTVKVAYLPPLYYEEYKEMKTTDIAEEVQRRVSRKVAEMADTQNAEK